MRKAKKPRLAALLLALVLLLAGCAAPAEEDSSAEPPPESGTLSGISGAPSMDGLSGGAIVSQNEPPVEPSGAEEDARLLARTGLVEGETKALTGDDVNEIKGSVASMRAAYVAGPGGKDPLVEERDWSVYTSSIGAEKLSNREAEFYNRLDKLCLDYLSSSALDGVKCRFSDGTTWDVTDTVSYGDLGLSPKQARNLAYWFKWNHPQYYFLTNGTATYSNELCFEVYRFAADGEKRAEATNQLFDKLEDWVRDVDSRASTTYEKELYANILLCEQNVYERQYEDPPAGGSRYDQSIYSSVLLGKTVCAGYALVFCAMMNAMDVDTTVGLSSNHAWNVVRFDDGNHYAVDVCWNDTDSTPAYCNNYLNIGEAIMSASNSRKEAHTYMAPYDAWIPAIAEKSYDPSEGDFQYASDEPQNLHAQEVSPTSVTLAWSEPASVHVNHDHRYEVGVFTDEGRKQRHTSALSHTFEPLNPNTSYRFGVRLCCGEDDFTSEWVYCSETTPDGEPYKRSKQPYDVKTEFQDADRAHTSWSGVGGIHYIGSFAEVCQFTDSTCTQIAEGYPQRADSDYGHDWTGLEPGKTYYFGVRSAKKELVDMVYSDWESFSYTHGSDSSGGEVPSGGEAPAAPANVKVTSHSKIEADMTWDPVPGASVYDVCAYTDSTYTSVLGKNSYSFSAEGNAAFYWTGVKEGNTYYFGIRAGREVNGETVYSAWVNVSYTHQGASLT